MSSVWSLTNVNVNEFLKLIDACKGDIYLVTDEGDKLNLKSKLSQLIGLSRLIEGGIINNASLVCENIEDEAIMFRYKLYRQINEVEAQPETEQKSENEAIA